MDRDGSVMTKRIVDLTMEMIYLLTGEKYAAVKMVSIEGLLQGMYSPVPEGWGKGQSPILVPTPHSLRPEKNNAKKILDVTQKITELLTGEVPIRCQDVSVYFSMEEWEYLEGHRDLYKDVMMDDQPPLTSPDGSSDRNPPEICPRPLYSRDSTHKAHNIPSHDQGDVLNDGSVPCVEEEAFSVPDDRLLQEDIPSEISRDGHHSSRSSEERVTCDMNDDDMVQDSQGGKPVDSNIHQGSHCADRSIEPSNSKKSFPEQERAIIPNIHPGLRSVASSPSPSNNEESPPMEVHTISPSILLELSRSPHPSFPNEPPHKLHTAPDIRPELHNSERSPHPIIPQESSLDVSHTLTPNIHLQLQSEDRSMDITNPEESTHDKTHITTSQISPGLQNMNRSPDSKETFSCESHIITPNVHSELSHPNECSYQSHADPSIYTGLHSSDRSVDPSNFKESSPIKARMLAPNIYSACESSLDKSHGFALNILPGLHRVERSADVSNPKESIPDHSESATLHMHPEPPTVNRLAVPLNPEVCHAMNSQTVTPNIHSEFQRSLDPWYPDELSASSRAAPNVNSGPHSADRAPDPCYPDELSARSRATPNVNSGPHSADRPPDPCYPDELSARSRATPNVNSGPHSADRPPDPCYPDELSARSRATPNVNSGPHSADRPPDPCYPDELSARSRATPNVNSGPHSSDRPPDPCYPDESYAISHTIPNVNSGLHDADKTPGPSGLGISSLVTLHAVRPNMHSSLNRSLDPSDPDESCDKGLPAPNINLGFHSSSRSPHFANPEESLPDKSYSVTPNIHSDHHSPERSLDLINPEKLHTATLDIHGELPRVDKQNSQESSSINSHVIISSELNRSLDPAYLDESSASSHTAPNIHSGFHKADGLLDHSNPGVSSLLKPHTVSWNVHSLTNRSPDPSYPVESSEQSPTAPNINPGLHATNRSPQPINSEESAFDIAHTVNPHVHPVLHSADSSMEIMNPEESSAEKPHTDTPDIHPGHHRVNRTSDPVGSCPMKSVIVTPKIYSEFETSSDPSFCDKSAGSHTAPNIHSGLQTEDRSPDPLLPEHLSSSKLLVVTLNVHPEFHCVDRSPCPSHPETSMKSHIISPNIRSLRGRSPVSSLPDKSADKCNSAPNSTPELHSPDRSLHPSYPEESSLDIAHGVIPSIHSGLHSVERTLDPEVSSHMESNTVAPKIHSLNRPLDLYYLESTAISYLSTNVRAEYHSENRSADSSVAVQNLFRGSPNVHPELHSVNGSLHSSHSKDSFPMKCPNIDSLNRSPEPSYPDEFNAKSHSSSNIHAGHHIENKSPEHSTADQNPFNESLSSSSNVHPELQSVNRSPNPSHSKESSSMELRTVSSNIHSLNKLPDPYYAEESSAKSQTSPDMYAGYHGANKSPDPSKAEQCPPNVSLNVESNVHPELHSVDIAPNPSHSKESLPIVSPGINSLTSPDPYHPDEPTAKSHSSSNIHEGHHRENRSTDHSMADQRSFNELLRCTSKIYQELHNVNRSPNLSPSKESFSTESHCVSPNVESNVHPEFHSVDRASNPSHSKESLSIVSPSINSLKSPDPYHPDEPTAKSHSSSNIHEGHHGENRSTDHSMADQRSFNELLLCTSKVYEELHNVNRSPNPSPSKESFSTETHTVSPNIHSPNKSADPYYPEQSSAKSHSFPNMHAGHYRENRPLDPSIADQRSFNESLSCPSKVSEELHNVKRTSNPSHSTESFSMESHDVSPNIHSLNKPLDPYYSDKPSAKSHTSPIIYAGCLNANNLPDPSIAEQCPPNVSLSVDSNVHQEHNSMDSLPNHSAPKELFSMKSHTLTPNIGLAFQSTETSSGPSNPEEYSCNAPHTVTSNIHSSDRSLDPNSNPEESSIKVNTIRPNTSLELHRVDRSPAPEVSFHVKSQCVTQETLLERHSVESSPSPSNPKESSSMESHTITSNSLPERADGCQVVSGLQESSQAVTLNIHLEPHSADSLPYNPEESPPDTSHAITPTIHPEPKSSMDRSPKSSEPEGSSSEKSHDVPNIHLEPHKADRSPGTSNTQKTSNVKPFAVTPNTDLALHHPRDVSNSQEHAQNKSHAPTANIGSGFNIADRSPDPSAPKQSLPDRSVLVSGNTEQNGFTKFSCSVCGRCFRRQSIFLKHWEMYCGKMLRKKTRLRHPCKIRSGKKSTPPAKRREIFKKKAVVLKEPNTQTSKTSFQCAECRKYFSQKSNLLQHRRIHTGVKPFSCLHCGKCFTKKISLETHIRIHSGERPFKCSKCNKCYAQRAHLDRHKRTHTGEKPYPCPECSKCFLQKCDLVKHRRIHAGLRPYQCSECGKTFTETSGLRRHRKLHQ